MCMLHKRICAGLFQPVRGGAHTGRCSLLIQSFCFSHFFIRVPASVRARVFGGIEGRKQAAAYCTSRVLFIQCRNLNSRFNMVVFAPSYFVAGKVLCRRRQTVPAFCRPSTVLHCLLYQIRVKVSQSIAVEPFLGLVTRVQSVYWILLAVSFEVPSVTKGWVYPWLDRDGMCLLCGTSCIFKYSSG